MQALTMPVQQKRASVTQYPVGLLSSTITLLGKWVLLSGSDISYSTMTGGFFQQISKNETQMGNKKIEYCASLLEVAKSSLLQR